MAAASAVRHDLNSSMGVGRSNLRRQGSHGHGGVRPASSYNSGGDQAFGSSIFQEQPLSKIAEQEAAALTIQSVRRGNSARQQVNSKRESRNSERESDLVKVSEAEMSVGHSLDGAIAAKHAKRSADNSKYLIDPRKSKFIGCCAMLTPQGLRTVRTGYAYQPPACRRVPASCAPYVAKAQGSLPPGPHALYVRGTRTSLGRTRTYRVP